MRSDPRVLDGQAPNVKIVADRNNDINDEASVDANSKTQHEEHISHLVHTIAQSTRPSEAEVLLEHRTERVKDAKGKR